MAHALLANDPMVIPDARKDDRFHDNPLVTGQPGIRFHAGRPLAAPNGLTASTRDRAKSAPAHSPASQRPFIALLSADDPADVGAPISRASRRRSRSTTRPTHAAMRSGSVSVTPPTNLRGIIRWPRCSPYPISTGRRTISAARPPPHERRRTARRYATIRATATAGVTATSAATRQPRSAPIAQLPHGGALAIASAICSGVRSR
jgi:hypothetical protein